MIAFYCVAGSALALGAAIHWKKDSFGSVAGGQSRKWATARWLVVDGDRWLAHIDPRRTCRSIEWVAGSPVSRKANEWTIARLAQRSWLFKLPAMHFFFTTSIGPLLSSLSLSLSLSTRTIHLVSFQRSVTQQSTGIEMENLGHCGRANQRTSHSINTIFAKRIKCQGQHRWRYAET